MASSSTSQNPLLYACIAYNSTILTEHVSAPSAQITKTASIILPKIDHSSPKKLTYTHGANHIHYIAASSSEYPSNSQSAGGLTYMCIAKDDLGQRVPFGFLLEAKKRFLEEYPPAATDFSGLPGYGCGSFNTTLKSIMNHHGSEEGQKDALKNVQREMDDVRDIMNENIERVLERGERIDLLVDKTDRLGGSARDFRVRSTGLRRRMWWKNVKLMALLILVSVFLLYLFIGFGCGLPGK
ncbi:vesicle-associated membrane protein [Microthyrium microscopicum]|uniref:Synaptobrevin homolog YKT6 n=1 Tax=Microthyrium microscopicum TaxID=703497 RepID=A0A6A6UJC0_9PEZI|nr:vesicle-associated membrane protein [Microthyrium microscopicum]